MTDPAFLFYPSDFLTGVSDLTFEERGQYITLLCLHHQKGRLSQKMITLCCGNATADVMAKFSQDEQGLYYNLRLEKEIAKRTQFADKQKERAINGWKKRKEEQSHGNATAMPIINRNRNRDINTNKDIIVVKKEEKQKIEIPDILEFINYTEEQFFKCGLNEKFAFVEIEPQVRLKYAAWIENNWHDGNGVKIKNWKSKATNQIKYYTHNGNKQQLTTIEKQRNSFNQLDKLFDAQLNKTNINISGGISPEQH